MKIQPARGTHDLFGDDLAKYKKILKIVDKYAEIYDFKELITPIFESTDLFQKPLGEHSDVVLKEMYTFKDRNESFLTLRPEHTTPMLRAAISNNLLDRLPQKLYGVGSAFRRERPQKGRYRQFNQINFETIGSYDFVSDVEIILLANDILKEILPYQSIKLEINSLGDKNTLKSFKSELSIYFDKYKNDLSEESQSKIKTNPLRILDSKNLIDKKLNFSAPKISDYYSKEANDKFTNIQNLLSKLSIQYSINNNLVRGLDYYCYSVFEFKTQELGSQDTLIGGGRYDGLTKVIGGPDLPGIGWAGGIERLIMLMDDIKITTKKIYMIIIDENFKDYGLDATYQLRKNNFKVTLDFKYNLKKSLSLANQLNYSHAIIVGENEFNNKTYIIKYLNENFQEEKTLEKIIEKLKS